jgi:hypothetical protein
MQKKVANARTMNAGEGNNPAPPGKSVARRGRRFEKNIVGSMARPLMAPQITKFQEAPCQKPLSTNVSRIFIAWRGAET